VNVFSLNNMLMKLLPVLFLIILSQKLAAQDSTCLNIVLKQRKQMKSKLLTDLKYVSVLQEKGKEKIKQFADVKSVDSRFILSCLPAGKYWLTVTSTELLTAPLSITVCTKCSNEFEFRTQPFRPDDSTVVFQTVEISPTYKRGCLGLVRDFTIALTPKQLNLIETSVDFTLYFFVTKTGAISDIRFSIPELASEIKQAVVAGLENLKDWQPAEQNGVVVDDAYSTTKQKLLGF
jgi:hypothetical protein